MKPEEQVRAACVEWCDQQETPFTRYPYEVWQAAYAQARREALEDAAKLVRNMSGDKFSKLAYYTLHDAADAIGALIKD